MPRRILIVDDDILVLDALRELLVADDYEVLTAARGQEALDILQREHVDLVILDLIMPKMTGLDVCKQVRTWKDEKSRVKIIMLSAKSEPGKQAIREEAEYDLYLTKPIDPLKLKELIHSTLGDLPQ